MMNGSAEQKPVPKHQIVADGQIIYESEVEDGSREVWRVWWDAGSKYKKRTYYYEGVKNMESQAMPFHPEY